MILILFRLLYSSMDVNTDELDLLTLTTLNENNNSSYVNYSDIEEFNSFMVDFDKEITKVVKNREQEILNDNNILTTNNDTSCKRIRWNRNEDKILLEIVNNLGFIKNWKVIHKIFLERIPGSKRNIQSLEYRYHTYLKNKKTKLNMINGK